MALFNEALFEASLCIETDEWTKQRLSELPTCKGVLLFADAEGRPIQLMQAGNLRRTAQAKLVREETCATGRKADISTLTATVFYTSCYNAFESQLTYIRLAHAIFRKEAVDRIQLPKISLAVIETNAYLPFFFVSGDPQRSEHRRVFGLFPSRKAAAEFCEILNAVFDLCRNPSLLNTGREASCPYLQMETCPGPCLDAGLQRRYAEAVRGGCEAAGGDIEQVNQQLYELMNRASQSMRFEQAAVIKKKLASVGKLTGPDFGWVHALENLRILHIDTGAKRKIAGKNKKRQLYKAWQITAEYVYALGDFVPKTPEQVVSFLYRKRDKGLPVPYTENVKEHLAMLAFFLFRSNPPGLWADCSRRIPDTMGNILKPLFSE